MSEAIPDPYSPDWIDGPRREEDSAYILELARQYRQELAEAQPHEIDREHTLIVLRAERERIIEHQAILLLTANADGANVAGMVKTMRETEDGTRILIDTALVLIRALGRDCAYEIGEVLDHLRRLSEGEL